MMHMIGESKRTRTFTAIALSVMLALAPFGVPAAHAGDGRSQGGASPLIVLPWVIAGQGDPTGYSVDWYCDDRDSERYWIGNASQLRGLSALVAGEAVYEGSSVPAVDFAGREIRLSLSIDLSNFEFTPIGTPEHPFAGTFDGSGRVISGLRVSERASYAGLFGFASESSELTNIRLESGDGVSVATDSEHIGCIGSLAGQADGMVSGCSSEVPVTVESRLAASEETPYTVQRVGGLVGYARGDVTRCSYLGSLNAGISADVLDPDSSSDSLRVADSFGGLVGRFGDPDRHGVLSDSFNEGDVIVQTYGVGAQDRFGTGTNAVAFYVGGIAGYSNGSIVRCHNGAYDENTRIVTGKVFTGVYKDGDPSKGLVENRGADEVGGICGSLRGNSDDPAKYNDGDPEDPVIISDCYNEAQVTGLVATAGIVGQTGVYCTVTRCYNGTISDLTDWQRNQEAGKVVSTRWNKPFSAGIVGQTRSGVVSYCANYAEIRNIQTGYYMAGIAGCIFIADDYPGVTGEIYSCFNSGGVYTINTAPGTEYREAGICGQNEGSVHDCIVMKGSVPYHDDAVIGASDWGVHANLFVKSPEELASAQSAALLNALAAQEQDWSCYWFINRTGYPVLNSWVSLGEDDRIELTTANIASVEQLAPAPWVGSGAEAMPTLSVKLVDGSVLVQDTDFRVIPQAGAYEIASVPYRAGVEGIGLYRGKVEQCADYYIGVGDLSNASVQVSPQKYRFGKVVFPATVDAYMKGSAIDPAEYDYVIYGSQTSASDIEDAKAVFAVFDSAGYISYTSDGATKLPVSSEVVGGPDGVNQLECDWWLWDRDGRKISDSAGNSYYTTGSSAGSAYGANTSCVNLKRGTPVGYVVQLTAHAASAVLAGSCIGYYVIDPVNIYRDCTLEGVSWNGDDWGWDAEEETFYRMEGDVRIDGAIQATFTGKAIEPVPSIVYGEGEGRYQLVKGADYRIVCGDPNPAEAGSVVDEGDANRNVTGEGAPRAAIDILPVSTSNMSNYVIVYFDIVPARFEDCEVSIASDEWAYTGKAVEPEVSVTLGGVLLQEDVDYTVSYADNVEKGRATYAVEPLDNLSGGSIEPRTGGFTIGDGIDLGGFTLDAIDDQQFNWGYDVHPALTFRDGGEEADLTEGVDYTVAFSTTKITKWSQDVKTSSRCTATVSGVGRYTGTLKAEFDIVPYDAHANSTRQLRAYVQDMEYGTWGIPPSATVQDGDATVYRAEIANVGLDYPVMMVVARPIVDWAAYYAAVGAGSSLEDSGCYGEAISLSTANNNVNGGLVARYPARYYYYDAQGDARGDEVNGNGGVYTDAKGTVIARPSAAEPGALTATVELRTGTGGDKGGAVGVLDCGQFEYTSPADISGVTWLVEGGSCTYDGTAKAPIVGVTRGTGVVLAEGDDYLIEYKGGTVDAGVVEYAVEAVEGEGKRFKGSYTGTFSIMPANLDSLEGLRVEGVASPAPLEDAAAGVTPDPAVYVGSGKRVRGVDYELGYANNHSVGNDAAVYVQGIGNYTGVVSRKFAIVQSLSLKDATVTNVSNATYSGAAVKRVPKVMLDEYALKSGTDYTVSYLRNGSPTTDFTSSGKITVRIAAVKGSGCTGTRDVSYTIAKASLSASGVIISKTSYTYNGSVRKPTAAVKLGMRKLAAANYSVTYLNASKKAVTSPKAAGTYYVKVTGKGNCLTTSSVLKKYTVAKAVNSLTVKARSNPLKASYRKKTTISASKAFKTVKNTSKGKLSYKKTSGNEKIAVTSAGKVTVKSGLKKGVYPVKVKVTSAATANYKAKSVTVALRVKVA